MPQIELLPALDIADGALARAPYGNESARPLDVARSFAHDGATWLHLADLDRAFGSGTNDHQLAALVREAHVLGMRTQYSGGIDNAAALTTALDSGCSRANISAAALADRDFVHRAIKAHGERIAVCVDVRGDCVHPRGRKSPVGDLDEILAFLTDAGCVRLIVTEIERDGALVGPPLALLERISSVTSAEIIASGGIASLDDIGSLAQLAARTRVRGAVVGRALLEARFSFSQALARVRDVEATEAGQPSERTT